MTLWMIQRPLKVRRLRGESLYGGRASPSEQAMDVVGSTRGLEIWGPSFLQLAR